MKHRGNLPFDLSTLPPEILWLRPHAEALLIGPAQRLARMAAATEIDGRYFQFRIRRLLADADQGRLRTAAVIWGVEEFDPRQRTEQRLQDQVARMLEAGRLSVRFLSLFRDDPRSPCAEGALSLYQIGKGAPPSAPPAPPPSPSTSPPPPVMSKSSEAPEQDVPNEPDQAATLKKAAEDGTPFCAICEALKASSPAP